MNLRSFHIFSCEPIGRFSILTVRGWTWTQKKKKECKYFLANDSPGDAYYHNKQQQTIHKKYFCKAILIVGEIISLKIRLKIYFSCTACTSFICKALKPLSLEKKTKSRVSKSCLRSQISKFKLLVSKIFQGGAERFWDFWKIFFNHSYQDKFWYASAKPIRYTQT